MQLRERVALLGVIVLTAAGCHRAPVSLDAVPVEANRAQFVGFIKRFHGSSVLSVDEDTQGRPRHGEIWITPTTEIVMRNGMVLPASWLRTGMRVTVWFRGDAAETRESLRATAERMLVEY